MRGSARHCNDRRGWKRSLVNDRFALKCTPPRAQQRGDPPLGPLQLRPLLAFSDHRVRTRAARSSTVGDRFVAACRALSKQTLASKPYWWDQSICEVTEETARTRKAGMRAVEKSLWCDLLIVNPGAAGTCGARAQSLVATMVPVLTAATESREHSLPVASVPPSVPPEQDETPPETMFDVVTAAVGCSAAFAIRLGPSRWVDTIAALDIFAGRSVTMGAAFDCWIPVILAAGRGDAIPAPSA